MQYDQMLALCLISAIFEMTLNKMTLNFDYYII